MQTLFIKSIRLYCGRLQTLILCPEFFCVTKRGARSNLPASLREQAQSQTEKGRRRKSTFQADRSIKCLFLTILIYLTQIAFADVQGPSEGLPLYYWNEKWHGQIFENFGDIISLKLVERI